MKGIEPLSFVNAQRSWGEAFRTSPEAGDHGVLCSDWVDLLLHKHCYEQPAQHIRLEFYLQKPAEKDWPIVSLQPLYYRGGKRPTHCAVASHSNCYRRFEEDITERWGGIDFVAWTIYPTLGDHIDACVQATGYSVCWMVIRDTTDDINEAK
jgi:hypothetical protein